MLRCAALQLALGLVFFGCSGSASSEELEELSRIEASLLVDSNGLPVIGSTTEVNYALVCDGEPIKSGAIPVPLDGSVVHGLFGSVQPAVACTLTLAVTLDLDVDLDPDPDIVERTASCATTTEPFEVGPGQRIELGTIHLVCRVDATGDVDFSGFIRLVNRSLDNYFVGPLTIVRDPTSGEVPPIALSLSGPLQPAVDYAWSVVPPDGGSFSGCDVTPEECQFFCGSNGAHQLVITANFGDETLSRRVTVACVVSVCGDDKVEAQEECDDGNTDSGDGCTSDCLAEFCGDSVVNNSDAEECDDGNDESGDGCSASCQLEFCGDGAVNNGDTEECDDGNNEDDDLCGNDCELPVCGDGDVEGVEECDLGTTNNDGSVCNADCTFAPNPFCESCLDDDFPGNSNENCSALTECDAVRDCVVNSNCYQAGGEPRDCYCGGGVTFGQCSAASFTPGGECVDEIRAAFVRDGLVTSNINIISQMTDPSTTSGRAFGILTTAALFGICVDECSLLP